jgi:hypothetical protein
MQATDSTAVKGAVFAIWKKSTSEEKYQLMKKKKMYYHLLCYDPIHTRRQRLLVLPTNHFQSWTPIYSVSDRHYSTDQLIYIDNGIELIRFFRDAKTLFNDLFYYSPSFYQCGMTSIHEQQDDILLQVMRLLMEQQNTNPSTTVPIQPIHRSVTRPVLLGAMWSVAAKIILAQQPPTPKPSISTAATTTTTTNPPPPKIGPPKM